VEKKVKKRTNLKARITSLRGEKSEETWKFEGKDNFLAWIKK
jgi:hypothetical protein